MPSPDENKIMRFLDTGGGQSSIVKVARELEIRIDYARIICESLVLQPYLIYGEWLRGYAVYPLRR